MADPAKLAALQELADTGTFTGAQQNLGASRDTALAQQSALGGLIGAPAQATASTMPVIQAPYGRFADALSQYQSSYDQSAASLSAANDQYFGQVASAQGAHRAEADRAIAEAQRAHTARNGGDGIWGEDLSQWEMEALATDLGSQYQDQAIADEGANAERNTYEADLAAQLAGWREIGDVDAQGQRAMDYELAKDGPTVEEQERARDQWQAENPQQTTPGTRSPVAEEAVKQARKNAMQVFVDEYAGSDRIGSRDAREQAYRYEVEARQGAPITLPGGEQLSVKPTGGDLTLPNGTTVPASEAQRYTQVRREGAEQSILNQMMLDVYEGGQFKQQAAMDLNLRPDLSPEAQALLYGGIFPEQTPEEQVESAKNRRELEYFEDTGFSSPQEQRAWEEAERKRAGVPDPNSREVRRPDDPDVVAQTGIDPAAVDQITQSNQWEEALATTESLLEGDEENGRPPVYSLAQLVTELSAVYDDQEMVKLLAAMYGPSMVG